ncbi:MAG: NUDIX domain-containing protein [Candidatus Nanohaloarchaea archaeon]
MSEPTDTAVAVVYHPGKHRFLVMQRSDSRERFPGYWEFPAGIIEEGESAKRAARRELKEETGLSGEIIRSGEPHVQETDYGDWKVHPFLFMVESGGVEVTEEHQDYMWVRHDEVADLKAVDGIVQDLRSVEVK